MAMPRPFKCRYIHCEPDVSYFKPRGIPISRLDEVVLTVDEFESVRLADVEGLYQDEAAGKMNVSRQTFGNIVKSARCKVADALVNGKAIKIRGGVYQMAEMTKFKCYECGHVWETAYGAARPGECPKCQSKNIHRAEEERNYARGRGWGGGRRGCRRAPV
jgi:predicted DNA-binding protein (UPF0251 family)